MLQNSQLQSVEKTREKGVRLVRSISFAAAISIFSRTSIGAIPAVPVVIISVPAPIVFAVPIDTLSVAVSVLWVSVVVAPASSVSVVVTPALVVAPASSVSVVVTPALVVAPASSVSVVVTPAVVVAPASSVAVVVAPVSIIVAPAPSFVTPISSASVPAVVASCSIGVLPTSSVVPIVVSVSATSTTASLASLSGMRTIRGTVTESIAVPALTIRAFTRQVPHLPTVVAPSIVSFTPFLARAPTFASAIAGPANTPATRPRHPNGLQLVTLVDDFIFHRLALRQTPKGIRFDFGLVNENFLAAVVRFDETETFLSQPFLDYSSVDH